MTTPKVYKVVFAPPSPVLVVASDLYEAKSFAIQEIRHYEPEYMYEWNTIVSADVATSDEMEEVDSLDWWAEQITEYMEGIND